MLGSTEGLESAEFDAIILKDPGQKSDHSRMPDHADPEGVSTEMPSRAKPAAKRKPAPAKKTADAGGKTAAAKAQKAGSKKSTPARGKAADPREPQLLPQFFLEQMGTA